MENLNPCLEFVLMLKYGLERGDSVRQSAIAYVSKSVPKAEGDMRNVVAQWITLRETGKSPEYLLGGVKSPYRQALLRTLDRGLMGESIHSILVMMEAEISQAASLELELEVSTLPIKMLLPLLLFQFPAFLLLLFGPLLNELLRSF